MVKSGGWLASGGKSGVKVTPIGHFGGVRYYVLKIHFSRTRYKRAMLVGIVNLPV